MFEFKTSNIEVNVPPKVITGNITAVSGYEKWNYPNGTNDQWWANGAQPRYYKWLLTVTVTQVSHGSHLTRQPYVYNGLDIVVGDYIAGPDGTVLRVSGILNKTSTSLQVIAEDYIRYNTFLSPDGTGSIVKGNCIFFETNEFGQPLIANIDTSFAFTKFFARVSSFFKYLNPTENYLMYQPSHGFTIGEMVSITSGGNFELTNNGNAGRIVGNVSQVLGTDHFMVNPLNKIIDYKPALPGTAGDLLYIDSNGDVSTTESGKLAFIKLTDAIPSDITATNGTPTLTSGDILQINDISVTMGTTVQSIADAINNLNNPLYSASVYGSSTTANSTLSLNYGLVGGFIPFSATINGINVLFNSDTHGQPRYNMAVADEYDIRDTINAANIPNVQAEVSGNYVILTSAIGDAITIVNGTNDTNNIAFAGSSSITGLPLNTAASTDTKLYVKRNDGGELNFTSPTSNSKDVVSELGLYYTQNGSYPIALYVEEGIRKGDVYTVNTNADRQNLSVLPGDSAYVADDGNGQWEYWLYSASGWTVIATEASAKTDSDTYYADVVYNSSSPILLGTVSDKSRVTNVIIEVEQPFDGNPTITVGDAGNNARLTTNDLVDLSSAANYTFTPAYIYDTGGTDMDLYVYFNAGGATTGKLRVILSYT